MINVMANELKETLSVMTVAAGTDRNVVTGSNVYFTGDRIALFSGDIFIQKPFQTDFMAGADAVLLENILDRYGTNEITINREENKLILKHKRSISRLIVDDNGQFPEIDFDEKTEWRKIPIDFSRLIEQACSFTSNNFNEPVKTSIHLNGRFMEASDGFHLGIFRMKGMIQDDLFIRKDFVKVLTKFEPDKYRISGSWICFQNAKQYFLAIRKIDIADYPNLNQIFNQTKGNIEVEFQDKVISSLEKAELFLRSELEFDRYVCLTAKEGKLTIATETKTGSYNDRISFPENIEFDICINPKYLIEMLYFTSKILVGEKAISCESKNIKITSCLVG